MIRIHCMLGLDALVIGGQKMKRCIISVFTVIAILLTVTIPVFAADEFDMDALRSSKLQKNGDFWSIVGEYQNSPDGFTVTVGTYLSSTYVEEGWGPELRITCRNISKNKYYEVTGFRATVNGKQFRFDKLAYNDNSSIHAGYLFGGNVYREFLETMKNVQSASFWFDYKDLDGVPGTVSIGHVHTGALGNLINVAKYLTNANAFSTDKTPDENDVFYGCSVK